MTMSRPMIRAKTETKDLDKGFKDLLRAIKDLKTMTVETGYFGKGATSEGRLSLVGIAAVNEFGTNNAGKNRNIKIPSRPFMAISFDNNLSDIISLRNKMYARIIEGKTTVKAGLNALGLLMGRYISETISVANIPPPNAPSTVERKGSSHTLIDTGALMKGWRIRVVGGVR